jgi:hypothetical protein
VLAVSSSTYTGDASRVLPAPEAIATRTIRRLFASIGSTGGLVGPGEAAEATLRVVDGVAVVDTEAEAEGEGALAAKGAGATALYRLTNPTPAGVGARRSSVHVCVTV